MADEQQSAGYRVHDPKGAWFRLNAVFDMEDPTPAQKAGGPAPCPKFAAGSFTQATETGWTASQHAAGVLTKYSGRPGDAGVVEVAAPAAAAPSVAAVETDEQKATREDAEKAAAAKAAADKLAADKAAANKPTK